jgi:hypothetical protein
MILNQEEANFLNSIRSELKEGVNEMVVINALRQYGGILYKKGLRKGKGGWDVDHQWSDKDLL